MYECKIPKKYIHNVFGGMIIFASSNEPHLCVTELLFKIIVCIQSSEWCNVKGV